MQEKVRHGRKKNSPSQDSTQNYLHAKATRPTPTPSSSFSLTPRATSPVFSAYQLLLFSIPRHGCFSTSHLLGCSITQLPSLPAPQLLNILASDSQLLSVPESQLHNSISTFLILKFSSYSLLSFSTLQLLSFITSTSHLSVIQLLSLLSFSAPQHLSF